MIRFSKLFINNISLKFILQLFIFAGGSTYGINNQRRVGVYEYWKIQCRQSIKVKEEVTVETEDPLLETLQPGNVLYIVQIFADSFLIFANKIIYLQENVLLLSINF